MGKKWRPIQVLFIGDQPSSRNVDQEVPFVGTPSYKRLLKWIGELDLDIRYVEIINAMGQNKNTYEKVVYLGKRAFDNDNVDPECSKDIYRVVDHPSPRNRKFNDPKYEKQMLRDLKRWIYNE